VARQKNGDEDHRDAPTAFQRSTLVRLVQPIAAHFFTWHDPSGGGPIPVWLAGVKGKGEDLNAPPAGQQIRDAKSTCLLGCRIVSAASERGSRR